jgi:hypothetical protein
MPAKTAVVSAQIPEVEGSVEGYQPVRLSLSTIHAPRISTTGAWQGKPKMKFVRRAQREID